MVDCLRGPHRHGATEDGGTSLESQADLSSVLPDETEPEAQGQETATQAITGRALCSKDACSSYSHNKNNAKNHKT